MPGERVNIKSFTALMERLAATPEGQAEQLAVEFLAKVNARMRALGMDNKALAQRMGTTPAYVTRLFRGSDPLSVKAMTRLAHAVDSTVKVEVRASV